MRVVSSRPAADFLHLPERDLLEPMRRYVITLGWPLLITSEGVFMPSNQGIVAITMTSGMGKEVQAEFFRASIKTPVLSFPGPAGSRQWAFLTEAPTVNGTVLPPRIGLISGSQGIPLPPTENSYGPVEWAVAPNGLHQIPTFARAMCAVRLVASKWCA